MMQIYYYYVLMLLRQSPTHKHIHFGGAVQKHLMQKLYESGRFQENVSPQMMII